MRILHCTSHLNIGGITRYVLALTEQHVQRGHQVTIASDHGQTAPLLRALGATHWPVPLQTSMEWSPQVFSAIRLLTARLQQEPVDILHAHTRVGQVVAEALSRRLHIPYVTTWHGIYRRRLGRRLWPCTGKLTIAISGLVRQHLIQDFRVPEQRIRCIYNGVDTNYYATLPSAAAVAHYRRHVGLAPQQPVVGAVGRLAAGRVKGFDTLLVAAMLLQEAVPTLQVLIVGEGPRRPFLEDVAERLGVRDRVHFIGEAADIRLPMAVMDCFVFSSRWPEAFGLTLVEAMAAGKPVVATRAGAVPEVVRHGVDGWLVPADDPAAMADGILQLLNDRARASRLGHHAAQRVREAFTLERLAAEVEAVYEETRR